MQYRVTMGSWHNARYLPTSEPQAITRAAGYHQDFRQIMFHFVSASGIIYLGKGFDELFEQGDSSNRDGMATTL
jgi:hypothetical protein